MKHYWIASTIEIKMQATNNALCACKMRGGREYSAQQCKCGKGVSPDTKKCAFRQQAFPNFLLQQC